MVGQRRYRACQLLQLDPVPYLVREGLSDAEAISLSLIENVHRADMLPLDKAKAFEALYTRHGSHEQVAGAASCSVATVRKYLKLLDLPLVLQQQISTADGPARVGFLSRLATTFEGEDAVTAFNEVSGFNQRVQEEILKRSEGDRSPLPALVEKAQEGVFDLRRCGINHGCLMLGDLVEHRLSELEFGARVRRAVQEAATDIDEAEKLEEIRRFFRSLRV